MDHDTPLRPIILIDESPSTLTLRPELEEEFEVIQAPSAEAAIRRVGGARSPDLILLDLDRASVSPAEVCRAVRAQRPTQEIPIIFVTSQADPSLEAQSLEGGAADYLIKPLRAAVVLARVRSQLRIQQRTSLLLDLVRRDPLTQLANRRRFEEALAKECRRAERNGSSLSVLFVDVDYFKAYNDTWGHSMGDECLRRVATALKNTLRRGGDLVARWGGEEFVAVLPDTEQQGANVVAERCRSATEALKLPNAGSAVEPHITISVGVITARGSALSVDELVRAADRALYRAKEGGRNQVAWAAFHSDANHDTPTLRWASEGPIVRRRPSCPSLPAH